MIVVVMGVSGCGKSSVGQAIAASAGWTFIEGDDLHPAANREKMSSGIPLDDEDRWPWLDAIANAARKIEEGGSSAVVACSALKEVYRDRLRKAGDDVRFVHLAGDRAIIQRRMEARVEHFMPPGLLDSQLATLEAPIADDRTLVFDIALTVDAIALKALAEIQQLRSRG